MKSKRRLLAMLTAFTMVLSLTPTMSVFAEGESEQQPQEQGYALYVNGEQFTDDKLTIDCGEGTATFDGEKTLTLKDAVIDKEVSEEIHGVIESNLSELEIVLEGENKLDAKNKNNGIDSHAGKLTISGEGSLQINDAVFGLYIDDGADLTVKGAKITVKDPSNTGIWVSHDITFDGSEITVDGNEKAICGIACAKDGTITVKQSTVTAAANDSAINLGFDESTTQALVIESGIVTLKSTNDYAINVNVNENSSSTITVNGGKLDVTSKIGGTNLEDDKVTLGQGLAFTKSTSLTSSGNVVIEAHEHEWKDWEVTRDASIIAGGFEKRDCKNCEASEMRSTDPLTKDRIFGSDRFQTAYKIADKFKTAKGGMQFVNVIIASGADYADALSAAYLAKVKNAPILLVANNKNKLSEYIEDISTYLKENAIDNANVYAVGGAAVVPEDILTALKAKGYNVKRVAGGDRYKTNIAVLKEAGVTTEQILVASGMDFADALSASAVGKPILLVTGKKGYLSDVQKDYLNELKKIDGALSQAYVIGGTGAVTTGIETQLKGYFANTTRVSGLNRYETSVAVANEFFKDPKPTCVTIAYGMNFPDGLCGGALAMAYNCPLLLATDKNTADAAAYTQGIKATSVATVGGAPLVSDKAVTTIFGK